MFLNGSPLLTAQFLRKLPSAGAGLIPNEPRRSNTSQAGEISRPVVMDPKLLRLTHIANITPIQFSNSLHPPPPRDNPYP